MAKKDADIVPFADQYRAQVLELQKRLWSQSPDFNDRYFRWKYEDNPNADKGGVLLAVANGRVVGMRGFMASAWSSALPGCEFIPLAGDTTIDTEFEGSGLVQRLTDAAKHDFADRGMAVMFNASASPAIHYHSLRTGWKAVGRLQWLTRSVSDEGLPHLARRVARKVPLLGRFVPAGLLSGALLIDGSRGLPGFFSRQRSLSLMSELDTATIAELARIARSGDKQAMRRDAAFFAWRFGNPYFRYHFLISRENGQVTGYFALQQGRKEVARLRIVDWYCADLPVFESLLSAVLQFRGNTVEIACMALTDGEAAALRRHGFADMPAARPEGVRKSLRYEPSVLAIPTGLRAEPFDRLVAEGFKILDFKGIETDCA